MTIDQAQLEEWCRKWQKLLRLQDWDVTIRLARGFKMGGENQGHVEWSRNQKTALIRIIEPGDYPTDLRQPQDAEQTLVHELLHLHYAPIDESEGLREMLLEQAIDSIAWGLVKADRGAQQRGGAA